MSQKMPQNIFNYATSELSQDAFLSLIIAWFYNEKQELRSISKDFINALYNEYFKSNIVLNIESVSIKQQYFKIDIYFEVKEENGNIIPFIIEDKTWTEPHSKQLNRYVDKVAKKFPSIKKDKIVKIFFKMGHITEKDKFDTQNIHYHDSVEQKEYFKVIPYYYKIIDIQWIWKLLSKYKVDHLIFNQYIEYIYERFYSKMYDIQTETKKELKDWRKYNDAKEGYVQYQIVEYIKSNLLKKHIIDKKNKINYIRNGKSWNTWWTFYEKPNQYKIFLKIVSLKDKYRIRLVEYSDKNTTSSKKKISLEENIKTCHKILKNHYFENIECGNKNKFQVHSGKNKGTIIRESEIANLNLDNNLSLIENAQIFSDFIDKFLTIQNESAN